MGCIFVLKCQQWRSDRLRAWAGYRKPVLQRDKKHNKEKLPTVIMLLINLAESLLMLLIVYNTTVIIYWFTRNNPMKYIFLYLMEAGKTWKKCTLIIILYYISVGGWYLRRRRYFLLPTNYLMHGGTLGQQWWPFTVCMCHRIKMEAWFNLYTDLIEVM